MMDPSPYRVAITGIGMSTALGMDTRSTWTALIAGKSARRKMQIFDTEGCRCHEAAEISLPSAPPRSKKSRASRLAVAPAQEALKQAGLWSKHEECTHPALPLVLSTTAGGMEFGENFLRRILTKDRTQRLTEVARYQPQQQVLDLQEELGLHGPSLTIANACASGANAIGHAADLIRTGRHDQVLAGGFEALTQLVYFGFDCLQSLSPDACRPFDQERNGLMLGEGAAFLVLENANVAQKRNGEILCYLTAYAHETDITHLTQPQPEGKVIASVVSRAIQQAGISSDAIAYLNAHGTATPMNDGAEALAYKNCFQENLPRISSTKAAVGHTLGAAGAMEAIFSILALRSGQFPPQCLTTHPLPEVASALCRPKEIHPNPQHVMSVNLGFGGSHAALIFSKSLPSPTPVFVKAPPSSPMTILATGAICPAGASVPSLCSSASPKETWLRLLSHEEIQMPIFQIDLESEKLKKWRMHPRLRRSSPLSLFMAEAASQALHKTDEAMRLRMGIVAAFGTGCNIYSRKFYADIIQKGRSVASPLLFPETVFNSPTSHIASIFGISGPCYSLAGDASAWGDALGVAHVWLTTKTVDYVLVLGAEELDVSAVETYRLFRWFKKDALFRPSEGAAAMLLGLSAREDSMTIDSCFPSTPYRHKSEALKILNTYARDLPSEEILYRGESHSWLAKDASRIFSKFTHLPENDSYQGEAFAASAGWQTIRALHTHTQHSCINLPIVGSNHAITGLKICRSLPRLDG